MERKRKSRRKTRKERRRREEKMNEKEKENKAVGAVENFYSYSHLPSLAYSPLLARH